MASTSSWIYIWTVNFSTSFKGPIIYIETSGEECLTPRQACGIESAARANPSMNIRIYARMQQNWVAQLGIAELFATEESVLVLLISSY